MLAVEADYKGMLAALCYRLSTIRNLAFAL